MTTHPTLKRRFRLWIRRLDQLLRPKQYEVVGKQHVLYRKRGADWEAVEADVLRNGDLIVRDDR